MAELEDPRKLLDQAVTDMQADMAKMRTASAQVGDFGLTQSWCPLPLALCALTA